MSNYNSWVSTAEMKQYMFGRHVEKPGPLDTACWIWQGATTTYGYITWLSKQYAAHRLMWMLHHHQYIPEGMVVCHSCDQGLCIRPSHLFLGTQQDNITDKMLKGRWRGAPEKLKPMEVSLIKYFLNRGWTCAELARRYGVTKQAIHQIKTGTVGAKVSTFDYSGNDPAPMPPARSGPPLLRRPIVISGDVA